MTTQLTDSDKNDLEAMIIKDIQEVLGANSTAEQRRTAYADGVVRSILECIDVNASSLTLEPKDKDALTEAATRWAAGYELATILALLYRKETQAIESNQG